MALPPQATFSGLGSMTISNEMLREQQYLMTAALGATTASSFYESIGGQGIANPGPQSNVQWLKSRVDEICRCWKT